MLKRLIAAVALGAALTVIPGAARAHHSFAMFDKSKEVMVEGVVREYQWKNPHLYIQLAVASKAGPVEWSLEGGSPNILSRNGWKRTSVLAGEKVKILINPMRDGRPGGAILEVHKANGEVLYYHG